MITIIIPRHIDRVNQIISQINELGLNAISRRSKKKLDNIDIYIVDTFGESKKFYKFATTVFLGGSIIRRGGQNPLEPARFGAKILHGPNIDNFRDVYKYLSKLKISSSINTPQQCANSIIFKKNMKKVKKMKYLGTTILKKTLNELDKSIHNEI
jgi:3-deoxy-D-manno-octulosonic-acid transferase